MDYAVLLFVYYIVSRMNIQMHPIMCVETLDMNGIAIAYPVSHVLHVFR